MKRRMFLLIVILVTAVLLAFLLRDALSALVVPLVGKIWFLLRGYYGSMEQTSYWPLVLAVILLLGFSSLRLADLSVRAERERRSQLRGEVQQMSFWLERFSGQGLFMDTPYPRWYVARTLANLAVEMLNRTGVPGINRAQLRGSGWAPPPDVQKYLEIALRSTPATFQRMLDAAALKPLPEVEDVIQYLESFVENSNDH